MKARPKRGQSEGDFTDNSITSVIFGFSKFLMLHHWLPSQEGFSELSGNKIGSRVKKVL